MSTVYNAPTSLRNLSHNPKSSKTVSIRYKFVSLLNQLEESNLEPILDSAIKLSNTVKSKFGFLDDSQNGEDR